MKRISKKKPASRVPKDDRPCLLVFGAHPDDIEFGCGAVIARETSGGRAAHFVVCSRGEAATHGTPEQRTHEAQRAAELLGATVEFIDFGGDAHFDVTPSRCVALARIIRRVRPTIVLAPTLVENQHPDHARLGRVVRDAARLARFGGLAELRSAPAHAIGQLLFYAITPEGEPSDGARLLVDVSDARVMRTWTAAMEVHASQMKTRNYVELQLTRARLNGLRAGVEHAVPLFAADAIVVDTLSSLERGARRF